MSKCLISMITAAICLVSLVIGCSHSHVVLGEIPRLDTKAEGLSGPFDHITVTLVNAQTDDSDYPIKWGRRNTEWLINRKLCTEKLVEALGAELMARHGKVVDRASVTLSLKVTEVTSKLAHSKIYLDATAEVTSNLGWKKTYVGEGDAADPMFSSHQENWNRAANWMITELVRVIMSDREFTAELSRKK